MSRIVDNLIAYRVLSMLVQNFEDSKAFKLGIIDKTGKNLKKANTLKTSEEKDAYNYLNRLVFNMKKIINKLPGGESKTKSLVAALWLVKETYESGSRSTAMMQEKFDKLMTMLDNRVSLVEEELLVNKFLSEEGDAGAMNVTGAAVSTDEPKIDKKNIKKFQLMAKRKPVTEDLEESWKDTMKWIPHPEYGYALSKYTSNHKSAYVFNDAYNAEQKQKHFGGKIVRNVAGKRILVKKTL